MNRTMIALCIAAALSGSMATQVFAQGVEASEAIASSDALSQISMYSYREGPKSDLFLRGTPLAATAEGNVQVEYQNNNAQIWRQCAICRSPPRSGRTPRTCSGP